MDTSTRDFGFNVLACTIVNISNTLFHWFDELCRKWHLRETHTLERTYHSVTCIPTPALHSLRQAEGPFLHSDIGKYISKGRISILESSVLIVLHTPDAVEGNATTEMRSLISKAVTRFQSV